MKPSRHAICFPSGSALSEGVWRPRDISRVISHMKSTRCSLDPVPKSLLQQCLYILVDFMVLVIKKSLNTGVVPSLFKRAIVVLLIKRNPLTWKSSETIALCLTYLFSPTFWNALYLGSTCVTLNLKM